MNAELSLNKRHTVNIQIIKILSYLKYGSWEGKKLQTSSINTHTFT